MNNNELIKKNNKELFELLSSLPDDSVGKNAVRNKIVENNLSLVKKICGGYSYRDDFEDIVAEGEIGLIKAVEKFDMTKGFCFSTYAFNWIRDSVGKYVDKTTSIVNIPNYIVKHKKRQGREKSEHLNEISESVQKNINIATSMQCLSINDDSWDESGQDIHYDECVESSGENDILSKEKKTVIIEVLSSLNSRERSVIMMYFGISGERMTNNEIGDVLGITASRSQQIVTQTLKKLSNKNILKEMVY